MAGYVIVNLEVADPERFAEYAKAVPETIARYGGEFLVRGGRAEKLEGDCNPKRVVVLKFETYERAREWWMSDEYKVPKALRQSSSVADIILVEGVDQSR